MSDLESDIKVRSPALLEHWHHQLPASSILQEAQSQEASLSSQSAALGEEVSLTIVRSRVQVARWLLLPRCAVHHISSGTGSDPRSLAGRVISRSRFLRPRPFWT